VEGVTWVQDAAAQILGVSPGMAGLRAYLPKVGRSRVTVLVTGETGTGKERVAQAIHALSPRRDKPFLAVNCAAIPEALLESELFGHERGAFTGAHRASRGLIGEASGGTLFLDEIGEMSGWAQTKMLRALETGEVQPVGGARPVPTDVRIIAATNQPLEALVAQHRFRADLFYRLNIARVDLPPLRERPEDVPVLFGAAVSELNRRDGRRVGPPDADLLDCLLAHDWPGNVRELRNLAEAIFIDPPDGAIRFDHLPPAFGRLFGRYRRMVSVERDRLLDALRATNWNKTETAKSLNWSRMTLYRKLARYNIDHSD